MPAGKTGELKHSLLPFWAAGALRDLGGNLVGLRVFGLVWREAVTAHLVLLTLAVLQTLDLKGERDLLSPSGHSLLVTLEKPRGNWVSSPGMTWDRLIKVVVTTTAANAEDGQQQERRKGKGPALLCSLQLFLRSRACLSALWVPSSPYCLADRPASLLPLTDALGSSSPHRLLRGPSAKGACPALLPYITSNSLQIPSSGPLLTSWSICQHSSAGQDTCALF